MGAARYRASRAGRLAALRQARATGNRYAVRSFCFDALEARRLAGIGRPRCRLTGRPFAPGESDMAGNVPIRESL